LILVNKENLEKLQGEMNESDFASKIGVNRSHLWRIKNGAPVGGDFIERVKTAFPNAAFEECFVVESGREA